MVINLYNFIFFYQVNILILYKLNIKSFTLSNSSKTKKILFMSNSIIINDVRSTKQELEKYLKQDNFTNNSFLKPEISLKKSNLIRHNRSSLKHLSVIKSVDRSITRSKDRMDLKNIQKYSFYQLYGGNSIDSKRNSLSGSNDTKKWKPKYNLTSNSILKKRIVSARLSMSQNTNKKRIYY